MKYKLLISAIFPPETTISGHVVSDLAHYLAKDHNVVVISPKPTRPLNFDFSKIEKPTLPFKHIVTDSYTHPEMDVIGRFKENKSFGKWCKKYIEDNHQDIELIYQNAWPIFAQHAIIKAATQYSIPCVTVVQDIYPESLVNKLPLGKNMANRMLLPMDKFVLKNSKKVICISDNMKNILSKTRGIDPSHFEVVVNWQDEQSFLDYQKNDKKESNDNQPFTFMYLGNNGPVAGVEFLIKCFVKANLQNARLIVAGGGSKTEDCKQLAKELGAKNIEFLPVPEGKVPHTQDLADVMLLPVKKNGAYSSIPSKLPAYMFSAKAIIGSLDVDSDTAKAIIDADAGIVVAPENEKLLVGAMQEIASWSKEELQLKGKNGFNYAMQNFSKQQNLKKIADILLTQV